MGFPPGEFLGTNVPSPEVPRGGNPAQLPRAGLTDRAQSPPTHDDGLAGVRGAHARFPPLALLPRRPLDPLEAHLGCGWSAGTVRPQEDQSGAP